MSVETVSAGSLVRLIRDALEKHADPGNAAPMQAYMKTEVPYRGVKARVRRKACNQVFKDNRLAGEGSWRSAVLDLWDNAAFREERYEAVDLTGHRYYDVHQKPEQLSMYEHMIVSGACIEPSIEEKEFFLRKAIGWSLREFAKVNPGSVSKYVAAKEDRLSGLSKREALRNVI